MKSNRHPKFGILVRCYLLALFADGCFSPAPALALPSTNGLLLWLDSSYTASVQTNLSGRVVAWMNKVPGATNSVVYTGNNDNLTSASYNTTAPSFESGPNGIGILRFNGNGYLDNLNFSTAKPQDLHVFLLGSASTNPGSYSAFMAFNQSQTANDYQTGLNMDQGENASATFNRLNVEGSKAGGGGGFQFVNGAISFNAIHLFEVDYGRGEDEEHRQITVLVDGVSQISLTGSDAVVNLNQCYIGTRAYASGGLPTANHNLVGHIACVLVYDRHLEPDELAQTRDYLNTFFNRPTLRAVRTSTNSVVISWPSPSTGWELEQSTNLPAASWETSPGPILTSGTNRIVIVNPPVGSRFYRLRR
jgi:hypothetical protein